MIPEGMEDRLKELTDVFLAENQKLNLSAFRTFDSCWNGNVLDSLSALDVLPPTPHPLILDLGTGGGFPLLPLALCLPQSRFVGLDATQKKIHAVQRILDTLKIENVDLICGRSEELGRDPNHREQYNTVTERAVGSINVALEYAAPFVKVGGHVLLWKSLRIDQELKDSLLARAELSCELIDKHVYELPGDWGQRQLLIFRKRSRTKDKYPRAVGVPKKDPLL